MAFKGRQSTCCMTTYNLNSGFDLIARAPPPPGQSGQARSPTPEISMSPTSTPVVTSLTVIPVAGRDSMLLNLSGAHGPFFTRNLLILSDNAGCTGVGEVPGGEKIRQTLEDARALVVGQLVG